MKTNLEVIKNKEIAINEVRNNCTGEVISARFNKKQNYFNIRCEVTSKNGNMLPFPYVLSYSVKVENDGFVHILK